MISTPGVEKRTLEEHGKDMKEIGINTIQFILMAKKGDDGHFYPQIGPLPGSLQLNYYKNLIVEAKKRGKIIAKVTKARTITPQPSRERPDFEGMWTAEAKGADILGLDFLPPFQGLDSYRQMIREQFTPVSKASAKLALPWLVAEYAQGETGVTGVGSSWNTQGLKVVFDEFLNSQPKPIGFSFNFWDFVEGEKNRAVKESFKEFYFKL